MDLSDERWWRDALGAMQLDASSFLQPLAGAAPGATGALGAPPSPSASSIPLPFDLSESASEQLAPRVLDSFPALALLRFKLVPARINEERFWRMLFYLIAQFHSANASATATATAAPSASPTAAAPAAAAPAAAVPAAAPVASRPLSSSLPKASRNGSVSPSSGRSTPLASARASPSASPRVATEFPALPPLPLLHHHHPLPPPPLQQQQHHPQQSAGHVTYNPASAAQLASANADAGRSFPRLPSRLTREAAAAGHGRDVLPV